MNKEELIIQISTGGYLEHKVTYEEISEALKPLLRRLPVKSVIIGWSLDRELYKSVLSLLKDYGVKCFLWLPVFSETGLLAEDVGRLLDSGGKEVKSYSLSKGENFEFYCPNQKRNIEAFLNIYEENFGDLAFDGVFLDKIRYGTFANGLSGVFSCFCPECQERYKMLLINQEALKAEMEKVRRGEGNYAERPLGIKSYECGCYDFEHPVWELFFRKKSEDITDALRIITDYFRKRGLFVGMDTFAPFLGYFAGQNVAHLSSMADFVKPMMYRITDAPAGLPFETDYLLKETVKGDTAEDEKAVKAAGNHLFRALGCKEPIQGRFDLDFVKKELSYMAELSAPVYCGIEINKNHVAPAVPDYILENLRGLKGVPIQGYVLSWDILSAPEENIRAVTDYFAESLAGE